MALTEKDVGTRLREARERKGLSLRQIAASTRISTLALAAIERNDIAKLPGGIFSRGFVRGYAQEVGLDPEETVRDFVEQFPVDAVTYGSPLVEPPASALEGGLDPTLKTWPSLIVIGTAVAVGVVGLTLAILWARGALMASASAETPMPPGTPVPPSSSRSPAPSSQAPPSSERSIPTPAPVPVAGLRVSVSSDTSCWVRIVADDVVRYEGLLENGAAQTREAHHALVLTVGDAGACQVTINGRRLRPLGAAGRVVTLQVTPETLSSVLAR